ncbi:MAG: tyrosine-type recombinase/integrase [Lachnospiraceae bacterium]|nr:tyrosine-type recombinase/integrase [Lachnospiraceae bacterium]
MPELTYKEQTDLNNVEKIREHLRELPKFCTEYFRSLEIRKSTNTRKNYAYDLGVFFYFLKSENPYFKDRDIRTIPIDTMDLITSMDIEEYLSFLESYRKDGKLYTNHEEGKARKLSSLKSFYDYYYKKGLLKTNPTRMVDVPKIKSKNIIRLDPDEIAMLLDKAESGEKLSGRQLSMHERTKVRDTAILTLLLGTGIRVSECVGLDMSDVDFNANAVRVIRKGGNEALVYFGDEVEHALKTYIDEERSQLKPREGSEHALFISLEGTRISTRSIERLVKKYSRLVTTVKKITPHKLRSTYGTALYRETGDIYLVADALGHKDVNTTKKHYAAIDEDKRRSAANAVKLREE